MYLKEKIPLRKAKNNRRKQESSELSYDIEMTQLGEIESIKIGLDNARPTLGNYI